MNMADSSQPSCHSPPWIESRGRRTVQPGGLRQRPGNRSPLFGMFLLGTPAELCIMTACVRVKD